jgi:hypothetical protein
MKASENFSTCCCAAGNKKIVLNKDLLAERVGYILAFLITSDEA